MPDATLPPAIGTDRVAPAQRAEFWRQTISSSFVALDCELPRRATFDGHLSNAMLEDVQVSTVTADAQRVSRTRERIRQAPDDCFLLSFQSRGHGRVIQDERAARLVPGAFALYDAARPYRLEFDDAFEQIVLRVPRRQLERRVAAPERLAALALDAHQPAAAIAFDVVGSVASRLPQLSATARSALHQGLLDIVAGALADHAGAAPVDRDAARRLLRERIARFVEQHLGDPDLSCAGVAAAHGLSVRSVRALFADQPMPLSDWIWQRRLEQARTQLEASAQTGRSITRIAFDCGFKDAAHFSRAFRARHGRSPSDVRRGRG